MSNKADKNNLHYSKSFKWSENDFIENYYGADITSIKEQELLQKLCFCRDALHIYLHIDVTRINMRKSGAILTIVFTLPTYADEFIIYVTIPIEEHSRPAYCIFKQICNTVKDKVKEIITKEN